LVGGDVPTPVKKRGSSKKTFLKVKKLTVFQNFKARLQLTKQTFVGSLPRVGVSLVPTALVFAKLVL
jgi:hypothetical protein